LTPRQLLKKYWGYDSFRLNQEDIIQSILNRKDTIALMPTGGGKSICYQIPGLILEGTVLVVSPLIALMQDQVNSLQKVGIKSFALTSGLTRSEIEIALDNCQNGYYKFLFVSPERLRSEWLNARLKHVGVSFVTIDEAHCISQWGHDFRPPYLKIKDIKLSLGELPFLALTATANDHVLRDIEDSLELQNAVTFKNSFLRENLEIQISEVEEKLNPLLNQIKRQTGSVIVYVRSRRKTIEISKFLNQYSISATAYHAGLTSKERSQRQNLWLENSIQVMVATTAFGMGIDKADVRSVFHVDLPEDLESYYQEIGRAGRDGKQSQVFLFYNTQDFNRLHYKWIELYPSLKEIKEVYNKIGSHLQIAVNTGGYSEHEFNLIAFCEKYQFNPQKTLNGLSFLEKQGLIQYSSSQNKLASIQIIETNISLSGLEEMVLKTLVRSFGGITEMTVKVDMNVLSKRLNKSSTLIAEALEKLKTASIIKYTPASEGEALFFLQDRVEPKYLNLNSKVYKKVVELRNYKFKALKKFAESNSICRNISLLNYFDEDLQENCGNCDVCLSSSNQNLEQIILTKLISPIHSNELLIGFDVSQHKEVIQILRILIETNKVKKEKNILSIIE
jgi:ATP-dependent DNA helicase RecQ